MTDILFTPEYIRKMDLRDVFQEGFVEGFQQTCPDGCEDNWQESFQKRWREKWQKIWREGYPGGIPEALRDLVGMKGWPLEEALNLLDVPECDRLTYRENLRELWAPPFSHTKNII